MKHVSFSSKADTLFKLTPLLKSAKILPLVVFSVDEYANNGQLLINKIRQQFSHNQVIIRSSCLNEDTSQNSFAGHYTSVLNVNADNSTELTVAIEKTIASYAKGTGDDQVFVQPMLDNVVEAGVVFTADITTLAPYYIINSDNSGSTESITSGCCSDSTVTVYFKAVTNSIDNIRHKKIINLCQELESLFANEFLDIEFAFDSNEQLFLFQVRPLTISTEASISISEMQKHLSSLYQHLSYNMRPHAEILGETTLYGLMPDWNPAEIIGYRPKQLALSLYKELITDSIWAYQRNNYGYRNLRSHPLMVSILGAPYIDIRVSFNSFVPQDLHDSIAEKLINYYLDKLISHPASHDKVEFEIVHSCYYFNLPEKLNHLLEYGFNANEIKRIEFSLLDLTNKIICPNNGFYKADLNKINILEEKYNAIVNSDLTKLDKIYWLLENCKRYGTLAFAGIARAAFIAVQFLNSFVECKIISENEYSLYMNSLNTISKKVSNGFHDFIRGNLSKDEFLKEFGFLRPGTYDITSNRYDEGFSSYFPSSVDIVTTRQIESPFTFSDDQIAKINKELVENGINADATKLLQFIKESIEGREYSKFIFTKSLSYVLDLVSELGKEQGIERSELAHLNINTLRGLYGGVGFDELKNLICRDVAYYKEQYQVTSQLHLPRLITSPDDIYQHEIENSEPTIVTLKTVRAETIKEDHLDKKKLTGRIVFIRSADPGYDYLFSHSIAGLVTLYGGANSHMAIRCAEIGIPAVIGSGEKNYKAWSEANILEIDGANKKITVLS